MRILVTGGCGFIGSHLVRFLVHKYPQYNIINMDKLDVCSSLANVAECEKCQNYKFVRGDITSADLVKYVLHVENINVIIHVAAQSHVDASFGNSLAFTTNNVLGTHVLLEAAKVKGITRFLHVSTDEVYGSCDDDCKTEGSATNPTNPYAASKAAAESIVRGYINSYKFPAIITRGNNVFGPNQYVEKLIPKMINRLTLNQPCCIHGDGSNRRHYLHVDDTVRAFDVVLHSGTLGETYNIGSPDEFTNLEIAHKLIDRIKPDEDYTKWIEHVTDRSFNDSRYFLSYDKLKALGWSPEKTIDASLDDIIEWYASHNMTSHWGPNAIAALEPHPLS